MVPDLELKVKLEGALDMSAGKENVIVPVVPESKVMPHEFNHEINAHGTKALFIEKTALSNENEDVEVDITDSARFSNVYPVEAVQKDVTESSSSFGDTESQTENGSILSDTEVESQLNTGNESSLIFEGWCEPFRIRLSSCLTYVFEARSGLKLAFYYFFSLCFFEAWSRLKLDLSFLMGSIENFDTWVIFFKHEHYILQLEGEC